MPRDQPRKQSSRRSQSDSGSTCIHGHRWHERKRQSHNRAVTGGGSASVRGRATARSNGREPEICAYRASSPIDCRLEAHKDAADLPVHGHRWHERLRQAHRRAVTGGGSASVRGRATARSNGREPEICAYRASSPIDCRLEAHKDAADLPVHRAPVAREAASGAPSRRRRRRKRGA